MKEKARELQRPHIDILCQKSQDNIEELRWWDLTN